MIHVLKFSEMITESLGRGSVVLIKGKPEKDGLRKLFVTQIVGYSELRPGAKMVFLSPDLYRIRLNEEGRLVGTRISFKNEDSLKGVLNFKSDGKLSVVLNNNKTPWHWKTTKHTLFQPALKDVVDDIRRSGEFLI